MKKFKTVIPYIGWKKSDTESNRRRAVLSAKKGDYMAASRALRYVSRNSNDNEVKRKAKNDSLYFLQKARAKRR